jgi:hypothetical protein
MSIGEQRSGAIEQVVGERPDLESSHRLRLNEKGRGDCLDPMIPPAGAGQPA